MHDQPRTGRSLVPPPGLPWPQQVQRVNLDAGGKPLDALERQVALSALDPTHVGPVDAKDVGEGFLAEAARLPVGAQVQADGALQVSFGHGLNLARCYLTVYRLISSVPARVSGPTPDPCVESAPRNAFVPAAHAMPTRQGRASRVPTLLARRMPLPPRRQGGSAFARFATGLLTALAVVAPVGIGTPAAHAGSADLDHSFGTGGIVRFGGGATAQAIALQPDGRIILVGAAGLGSEGNFAVARLLPTGALDPSFSEDGATEIDFGPADIATSVLVQPDGRIVVIGSTQTAPGIPPASNVALARLTTTGDLDPTFGAGGKRIGPAGYLPAAARQADGKLVVAAPFRPAPNSDGLTVARFTEAGELDASFSGDGVEATAPGLPLSVAEVLIRSDQKIVVVGDHALDLVTPTARSSFIRRYTASGTPDPSGSGGTQVQDGTKVAAAGVQADGKIVVVGCQGGFDDNCSRFLAIRHSADGVYDSTFGGTDGDEPGTTTIEFSDPKAAASALVVLPDDRLMLAGRIGSPLGFGGPATFAGARLTANGRLDRTYSGDGKMTLSSETPGDPNPLLGPASGLVRAPDGTLVASSDVGFGAVRMLADGEPTSTTPALAAPTNTSPPTISGEAKLGSTLTCNPGSWTESPTLTYQWLRAGGPMPGAISATYTVTYEDAGQSLACRVTARNAAGETGAASAAVTVAQLPVVMCDCHPPPRPPCPACGPVTGSGDPALTVPSRLTRAQLRRGFTIKLTGLVPGSKLTTELRYGKRLLVRRTTKASNAGNSTITLKPKAKTLRTLKRGARLAITSRVATGDSTWRTLSKQIRLT